jgi:hypothetical protein
MNLTVTNPFVFGYLLLLLGLALILAWYLDWWKRKK